jgi:radical SAM superfamily enzyme YgiQ (UPF0313 family)
MLTDFGCPYKCTFCPISTIGFKLRGIDEVIEEVKYLQSLGVQDIYFRDQTFGVNKKRTMELCQRLASLNIGWTCFTRVDVIDDELASAIKRGGCHTVMFGIETLNETLLKKYLKDTSNKQVRSAIELCARHSLDVVGFFIIGLPGDTREMILKTIEFAKKSGIDFASFNRAMPRLGTNLRKEAVNAGIVDAKNIDVDSSGSIPKWRDQEIKNEEITDLHRQAFRKFYLRPGYLMKRFTRISTFHQFVNFTREGCALIMKQIR